MNRRAFMASLAAAFVAPDPDRILWRPGAKMISVPAPPVRAYAVLTHAELSGRWVLVTLQNNADLLRATLGEYGQLIKSAERPLKVGDTIALRRPPRFALRKPPDCLAWVLS